MGTHGNNIYIYSTYRLYTHNWYETNNDGYMLYSNMEILNVGHDHPQHATAFHTDFLGEVIDS